MLASLPMYEIPQTRPTLQLLWSYISQALTSNGYQPPEHLLAGAATFSNWESPDLILSQTCGLPYRARLHRKVSLVGTPDLQLTDCAAGFYRSAIVVRSDDERSTLSDYLTGTVAANELVSQSGYAALKHHLSRSGINQDFSTINFTGGHRLSALTVASGGAVIKRYDDFARQLRVLEWTEQTPALPLICAKQFDALLVAEAVTSGLAKLSTEEQKTIGFYGLVNIPSAEYLAVPTPQESLQACLEA